MVGANIISHNIRFSSPRKIFTVMNSNESWFGKLSHMRHSWSTRLLILLSIISTFRKNFKFFLSKYDKFIKNIDSLELWSFYKTDLENIQWSKEPVKSFFLRLLGVIKIVFGLFLVSNTTSIYIMVTIVSAPILLLSLCTLLIYFIIIFLTLLLYTSWMLHSIRKSKPKRKTYLLQGLPMDWSLPICATIQQ